MGTVTAKRLTRRNYSAPSCEIFHSPVVVPIRLRVAALRVPKLQENDFGV
jgi:hypothetical protein